MRSAPPEPRSSGKVGSIDAALDIIAKTEHCSIHTDRRQEKKNSQQGFVGVELQSLDRGI